MSQNVNKNKIAAPCWKARALQQLSTHFEKMVLEDFETTATDAANNQLNHEQVQRAVFNAGTALEYQRHDYFTSAITGPNGYYALAVHRTPYTAPVIILEYNTDLLQIAEADFKAGENAWLRGTDFMVQVESTHFNHGTGWSYSLYNHTAHYRPDQLQKHPQSAIDRGFATPNAAPNSIDMSRDRDVYGAKMLAEKGVTNE